MKKIDLHIHTLSTISDPEFEFDIETLKNYVYKEKLDCIAITNHNKFDRDQYLKIVKELENMCIVLPGIEINIGIESVGHLICITDLNDIDDFSIKCKKIENKINHATDFITFEYLKEIFIDLDNYLWIPHYYKKPEVDKQILEKMKDNIICGEVGSVKKFIYSIKNDEKLTPVYFSDVRIKKNAIIPTRYTYFDLSEISIKSIKICLRDKNKVSLTEKEGNFLFDIIPNLPVSTGLNVILGERSSGKTFLLDEIFKRYDNIKYIKQFELIEPDPEKAAKDFTKEISNKSKTIEEDYLKLFKNIIDDISLISIKNDNNELDNYIKSLLEFANETDRIDMFSKCGLYSEILYSEINLEPLKKLIESTKILIDNTTYKDIIERYINKDSLNNLLKDLIKKFKSEKELNLKKNFVNGIVSNIKDSLNLKTSTTPISNINLEKIIIDFQKVNKFNKIIKELRKESIIEEMQVGNYKIQIKKNEFKSAKELKDINSKKTLSFANILNIYEENPYEFLESIKQMSEIPNTDYYKYFIKIEYIILNKYGIKISGGERAEFKLLQKIKNAMQYDLLLIDEPEASFDNIFLNNNINKIIKDISKEVPVFIVTHNNNIGYSIKPDYIINTIRKVENGKVIYERYYGRASDKELKTYDNKKINNYKVIMDCLEGGEETFNERKQGYEILKD